MNISLTVHGMDRALARLRALPGSTDAEVVRVLQDTLRAIGERFSRTAPIGRTGQLYRSGRFRRTRDGASLRLAVRHGKPSEANKPKFNDAIKAEMKGIRGRIRAAMKRAAG